MSLIHNPARLTQTELLKRLEGGTHVTRPSQSGKAKKTNATPAGDVEVIDISSDSPSDEKNPTTATIKTTKQTAKLPVTAIKPLPLFLDEDSISEQDEDEAQQEVDESHPSGEHTGGVSDLLHTVEYDNLDDGSILVL
jgi:hypothetical protein